jgi:hypothetical protein
MSRKNLLPGFALLFAAVLVLVLFERAKADQLRTQTYQQAGVVEYLRGKFDQLGVPVDDIVILQDDPLEIQVTLESLGTDSKGTPEDSINVHTVFRESMLASDRGYQIYGLTTDVVNIKGDQIFSRWTRIKPESMYHRLEPPGLSEAATGSLLNEKLAQYELSPIDAEVISSEGFQTLNLFLSGISKEDASLIIPPIKDKMHLLTQDMNSQGAGVALVTLRLTAEMDEPLVVYYLDLQFRTEGWWAAEEINIDSWYASIPALPPTP